MKGFPVFSHLVEHGGISAFGSGVWFQVAAVSRGKVVGLTRLKGEVAKLFGDERTLVFHYEVLSEISSLCPICRARGGRGGENLNIDGLFLSVSSAIYL